MSAPAPAAAPDSAGTGAAAMLEADYEGVLRALRGSVAAADGRTPPAAVPAPAPGGAGPARLREVEAALQRSLAAESALQAELTPLRGRLVHLEGLVERQRSDLVRGVEQLLSPLVDTLRAQGYEVSAAQAVGVAVEVLGQGPPVAAAAPDGGWVRPMQRLAAEVAALIRQVERLEAREPAAMDPPPEGYGTWVTTDGSARALEQELLREQTRRGGR